MSSNDPPESDLARISLAFERCVVDACPEHAALAMRVFERLTPGRWMLEWHLPWWLGDAFGLDRGTADEIVLSNILGLASIRLLDDLADGEVAEGDTVAANALGTALYRAAVAPYRRWFPMASPFWPYLEWCMATWRSASGDTAAGANSDPGVETAGGPDTARLAARGAPLKISAFAVSLLTRRERAFPLLDRCLDHALAGLALYDDLGDWRADLAAGRWNAFVASAAGEAASFDDVLLAMLTGEAVATHVARIAAETKRAAAFADDAGVVPLAEHLRASSLRTEQQGVALHAYYRDLAERAGRLLGGLPSDRPLDRSFAGTVPSPR